MIKHIGAFSLAVLLTSCGIATNKSAKAEEAAIEAYIATIDSTTAAIQNAQNVEDFQRITSDFAKKARAFADEHKTSEAPKVLLEKTTNATIKYQEAVIAKVQELSVKEAANYSLVEPEHSQEE